MPSEKELLQQQIADSEKKAAETKANMEKIEALLKSRTKPAGVVEEKKEEEFKPRPLGLKVVGKIDLSVFDKKPKGGTEVPVTPSASTAEVVAEKKEEPVVEVPEITVDSDSEPVVIVSDDEEKIKEKEEGLKKLIETREEILARIKVLKYNLNYYKESSSDETKAIQEDEEELEEKNKQLVAIDTNIKQLEGTSLNKEEKDESIAEVPKADEDADFLRGGTETPYEMEWVLEEGEKADETSEEEEEEELLTPLVFDDETTEEVDAEKEKAEKLRELKEERDSIQRGIHILKDQIEATEEMYRNKAESMTNQEKEEYLKKEFYDYSFGKQGQLELDKTTLLWESDENGLKLFIEENGEKKPYSKLSFVSWSGLRERGIVESELRPLTMSDTTKNQLESDKTRLEEELEKLESINRQIEELQATPKDLYKKALDNYTRLYEQHHKENVGALKKTWREILFKTGAVKEREDESAWSEELLRAKKEYESLAQSQIDEGHAKIDAHIREQGRKGKTRTPEQIEALKDRYTKKFLALSAVDVAERELNEKRIEAFDTKAKKVLHNLTNWHKKQNKVVKVLIGGVVVTVVISAVATGGALIAGAGTTAALATGTTTAGVLAKAIGIRTALGETAGAIGGAKAKLGVISVLGAAGAIAGAWLGNKVGSKLEEKLRDDAASAQDFWKTLARNNAPADEIERLKANSTTYEGLKKSIIEAYDKKWVSLKDVREADKKADQYDTKWSTGKKVGTGTGLGLGAVLGGVAGQGIDEYREGLANGAEKVPDVEEVVTDETITPPADSVSTINPDTTVVVDSAQIITPPVDTITTPVNDTLEASMKDSVVVEKPIITPPADTVPTSTADSLNTNTDVVEEIEEEVVEEEVVEEEKVKEQKTPERPKEDVAPEAKIEAGSGDGVSNAFVRQLDADLQNGGELVAALEEKLGMEYTDATKAEFVGKMVEEFGKFKDMDNQIWVSPEPGSTAAYKLQLNDGKITMQEYLNDRPQGDPTNWGTEYDGSKNSAYEMNAPKQTVTAPEADPITDPSEKTETTEKPQGVPKQTFAQAVPPSQGVPEQTIKQGVPEQTIPKVEVRNEIPKVEVVTSVSTDTIPKVEVVENINTIPKVEVVEPGKVDPTTLFDTPIETEAGETPPVVEAPKSSWAEIKESGWDLTNGTHLDYNSIKDFQAPEFFALMDQDSLLPEYAPVAPFLRELQTELEAMGVDWENGGPLSVDEAINLIESKTAAVNIDVPVFTGENVTTLLSQTELSSQNINDIVNHVSKTTGLETFTGLINQPLGNFQVLDSVQELGTPQYFLMGLLNKVTSQAGLDISNFKALSVREILNQSLSIIGNGQTIESITKQ